MNAKQAQEALNLIDDAYLEEALALPLSARRGPAILKRAARAAALAAAVLIAAFVGFVNLFPAAAYAMGNVPLLGALARAVTIDPSMRACLKNDYAQYVGESQTAGEYRSEVYYMVVDASRVSIFFRMDVPGQRAENADVFFHAEVTGEGGGDLSHSGGIYDTNVEGLYEYRIDIADDTPIPQEARFTIRYLRNAEEVEWDSLEEIASVEYVLYPDDKYARVVARYEIGESAEILGQRITLDRLEVYPTQAKLFFSADEENTALLTDIRVALYDDRGRAYEARGEGVTGTLNDAGGILSKWYESPYFAKSQSIRVKITAASFLEKSAQFGAIDPAAGTIGHLPEGVTVASMLPDSEGGLEIALKVRREGELFPMVASMVYLDASGAKREMDGYGFWSMFWSEVLDREVAAEEEDYQYQAFTIPDFADGCRIEWIYAPSVPLPEPVEFRIGG